MNQLVQELNNSLKAIEPKGAEVKPITQIITYSLIATALVGIAVYSYIKQAEKQN